MKEMEGGAPAAPKYVSPTATRAMPGLAELAPPSIRFNLPIRALIRVICGVIMLAEFEKQVSQTLEEIKSQGLYKTERIITTPQDAHIAVAGGERVLNMCANNYLGLADRSEERRVGKESSCKRARASEKQNEVETASV